MESAEGALTYSVSHIVEGVTVEVIHPSQLGIIREDQAFADHLTFDAAEAPVTIDEIYSMTVGKQRELHNNANELKLDFHNENGAQLQIVLRAYDDGVAFRYRFPEVDLTPRTVLQELTTFAVSTDGRMWSQPYDQITRYSPAYERLYTNGAPIGMSAEDEGGTGWAFPTLLQVDQQWILLTEADLDASYFGAHLGAIPRDGVFELVPPLTDEARGFGAVEPAATLPWTMPWRVIMVGTSVGTIFELNLVTDLSASSRIADTSWIHPGRVLMELVVGS